MKKILFLIIAISTLISCSKDDDNNGPSELKIRLSNSSLFDYQNIVVNTSSGDVEFNDLDAGQSTEYKVFEKAYRYAFVELVINGGIHTIQPVDYIGEKPLKNGNYTFQINANDSQLQYEKLSLKLIVDK